MVVWLQGGKAAHRAGHEAARVAGTAFHEGPVQETGPEAGCQGSIGSTTACPEALSLGESRHRQSTGVTWCVSVAFANVSSDKMAMPQPLAVYHMLQVNSFI